MATAKTKLAAPEPTKPADASKPSPQNPQFFSPDGSPIHVTLPDGRATYVSTPRFLPRPYWRAALKAGCATSNGPDQTALIQASLKPQDDQFSRQKVIKDKILEAIASEEGAPGFEGAFTANGIPNVEWLSKAVGFGVERSERDEIWSDLQRELDEADAIAAKDGDA